MTYADAVINQPTRTANGMKARQSTANACLDLFYKIGAARNIDIIPAFVAALVENEELACRIALWARDVRQGAGERKTFRDILQYLEKNNPELLDKLLARIPEIGRWDDLLCVNRIASFQIIRLGLAQQNRLCAKWMPRKGPIANKLRKFLGKTPKEYRQLLVRNTDVVESKMCNKEWEDIKYPHVPSRAMMIYNKAFFRHDEKGFSDFIDDVKNKKTTIKSQTLYPYDIIHSLSNGTSEDVALAQWEALPNYVGNNAILPMVDVSGSMCCQIGATKVTCLDVAVALGLYCADKNEGVFKDVFCTFSTAPQLLKVQGNLIQKMHQMKTSTWGMDTNLHAAVDQILATAIENNVPGAQMPKYLMVLSDMQFNECVSFDDSAFEMIKKKYESTGYEMPKIIFWNLEGCYDNVPVQQNEHGVALVSGFSPSVMTSILENPAITPYDIMLKTVDIARYQF